MSSFREMAFPCTVTHVSQSVIALELWFPNSVFHKNPLRCFRRFPLTWPQQHITRVITRLSDPAGLGSPPPKEESPSTRQTVRPQGAARGHGASGRLSPPEDGAVRCAMHRDQSLRGLRQVRQRRLRLALLRQYGRPWRWVSKKWSFFHFWIYFM